MKKYLDEMEGTVALSMVGQPIISNACWKITNNTHKLMTPTLLNMNKLQFYKQKLFCDHRVIFTSIICGVRGGSRIIIIKGVR